MAAFVRQYTCASVISLAGLTAACSSDQPAETVTFKTPPVSSSKTDAATGTIDTDGGSQQTCEIGGTYEMGALAFKGDGKPVCDKLAADVNAGTQKPFTIAFTKKTATDFDAIVTNDTVDAAVATGRLLSESAPASPLRRAVTELAASLAGVPAPATGRRRRRWR